MNWECIHTRKVFKSTFSGPDQNTMHLFWFGAVRFFFPFLQFLLGPEISEQTQMCAKLIQSLDNHWIELQVEIWLQLAPAGTSRYIIGWVVIPNTDRSQDK